MNDRGAIDRREFLRRAALAGGVGALSALVNGSVASAATVKHAASVPPAGSDLGAIEHVIFMMMENRSFDHYFGTYPGVRGFDDHPKDSLGAFSQYYPANNTRPPIHRLLPFRFDTVDTDYGMCTYDLSHEWLAQHRSWNGGRMDSFVKTHTSAEFEGAQGVNTMGYYTRADLPYYYALADAFTLCDGYHCSVLAMTHPNRLMQLSGTLDPDGHHGGPILVTSSSPDVVFSVNWETMPEVLEDAGISWKYYNPNSAPWYNIDFMTKFGITTDVILPYFSQYKSPSSPLHQKAFLPTYPDDFEADVRNGTLPQVSWICPPPGWDEHPPAPAFLGEWLTDQVLRTLVSNPEVWSKTVLFHMYDENDGFFDHVPPPVAERGTPGEYVTVRPLPAAAAGMDGPIGLGVRVPLLVISPFSRGGYICSDVFDHTSQLRFLEERFGVRAPNISEWRRRTAGDLTSSLHMGRSNMSLTTLPPTQNDPEYQTEYGCTGADILGAGTQPLYPLPDTQSMPTQEPGKAKRLTA